jgi:predicted ATPase
VLNEPETSLHPDLLPALGRLIARAAARSQVIVVSHAPSLVDALRQMPECHSIALEKKLGETEIAGEDGNRDDIGNVPWRWPSREVGAL